MITRGVELGVPLEHTLSCMNPIMTEAAFVHFGECSKCRERRDAFIEAGVEDKTRYAVQPAR